MINTRRILTTLALCAVAAMGVSGVAAGTAMAECRLVKEAGTGNYENNTCTLPAPPKTPNAYIKVVAGTGKYAGGGEWCYEVEEAGTGNYENNTCTLPAPPKTPNKYIKVWSQGPYYNVSGIRLLEKESKNIVNSKTPEAYVLKGNVLGFGVTITCKTSTVAAGGHINGSTGLNFGSSEETVEYTECTQTGDGSPCSVVEPITTNKVDNKLAYSSATRSGKIDVFFEPAAGTEFVNIKFTGSGCLVKEAKVTGTVAAEAWSGKKAIEVGSEPAETKVGEVHFPTTAIKEVWLESAGTLVKKTVGLEFAAKAATLTGTTSFELEGSPNWGVFTK